MTFDKETLKVLLKILIKDGLQSDNEDDANFVATHNNLLTKLVQDGLVIVCSGRYLNSMTDITTHHLTGKGQATLNEMLAHPYTIDEHKVDTKLVDAHNIFISLPVTHPSELQDWIYHLHALQQILAMRILRRDYPHKFVTKS